MFDYINLLPQPDLVIHPIANHTLCERRVYERGLWQRFQQKSRSDVSRYIANACAER